MRAAIYVTSAPGERHDDELACAHAFCATHGLEPRRLYHSDFARQPGQLNAFLAAAACGVFDVLVAPSPECFPTRFLKQLVGVGVGLACYGPGHSMRSDRA